MWLSQTGFAPPPPAPLLPAARIALARDFAGDALSVTLRVEDIDRVLDVTPGGAARTVIALPFATLANLLRGSDRTSAFTPTENDVTTSLPVNLKTQVWKAVKSDMIGTDAKVDLLANDYCGFPAPAAKAGETDCVADLQEIEEATLRVNNAREVMTRVKALNDMATVNIEMSPPKMTYASPTAPATAAPASTALSSGSQTADSTVAGGG